jgi:hypothetical protein
MQQEASIQSRLDVKQFCKKTKLIEVTSAGEKERGGEK